MPFENLVLETENRIATVTFNRPKAMNALNNAMIDEFSSAVDMVSGDREIKVLILQGAGGKAFIAGADISELSRMTPLAGKQFSRKGQTALAKLENLSIPVIAAVNGYALGGGTEVALACDFIYASEKSMFGLPEITLGLIPGFGGTQRLSRIVGANRAKELIFTGKTISAAEASDYGIVNLVCDEETLMEHVLKTAGKMASMGRAALRAAKESVNCAGNVDIETGTRFENGAFSICMASADAKEGTTAFLEKRKPEFNAALET